MIYMNEKDMAKQAKDMAKNIEQIIKDLKEFYPDGNPYAVAGGDINTPIFIELGITINKEED